MLGIIARAAYIWSLNSALPEVEFDEDVVEDDADTPADDNDATVAANSTVRG